MRLDYDEEGLPRLQLTMDGATFVHHSAPMLVGPRGASVFEVMAFDTDYQRHDLEVRLRELNSEAESTGCQ